MYEAGISLKLNENVVQRLEQIEASVGRLIPQMEKLATAIGDVGSMKGVNKSLNQMANNLERIERNSQGLHQVNSRIQNVGNTAQKAEGHMSKFGKSLKGMVGSAVGQLGLLAGAYLSVNTAVEGFKKAMDFQLAMGGLSFKGYNTKQKTAIQDLALSLPGKYAVTPTDIAHYAAFALGAGLSPDESIASIRDAARFEHAMKKVLDPKVRPENISDYGLKIAELAGKRNPAGVKQIQDLLVQTEGVYGGILPMDQLLRQYSMMRMARIGADPRESMLIAGHFLAEQMGGKGGAGSSGGVGIMLQAFQRAFVQGALPLAAIQNMQKAGLLTGYDDAVAKMRAQKIAEHDKRHPGGGGRLIHISKHGVTTDASGMHIVSDEHDILRKTKGGAAWEPKINMTAAAMREFGVGIKDANMAQEHPLEWIFTRLIPGVERFQGWKQGAFFGDKNISDTQRAVAMSQFLPGTRATLLNLVSDLSIYHKRIETQQARMGKMPGVDKLVDNEDQTKVRLEKLSSAWEAFNVKLWNNKHVLDALNKSIDALTNAITLFNRLTDPVINFFARIAFWLDEIGKAATGKLGPDDVNKLGQSFLAKPPMAPITGAIAGANADLTKSRNERAFGKWGRIMDRVGRQVGGALGLPAIGQTNEKLGSQGFVTAPPPMAMEVDKYGNLDTASMLKLAGAGYGAPAGGKTVQPIPQKSSSGSTTMNFNFGHVFGTDKQDLAHELFKMVQPEVDRHQRKNALNASYTTSGGQGNLNSKYMNGGGGK